MPSYINPYRTKYWPHVIYRARKTLFQPQLFRFCRQVVFEKNVVFSYYGSYLLEMFEKKQSSVIAINAVKYTFNK